MPIKRKDFNSGKFVIKYTDRSKHPVLLLLYENTGLAFRADEIAKRCKMGEDTVRSMLRQLQKAKKVIHKTPYFAWKTERKVKAKKKTKTKKKKK